MRRGATVLAVTLAAMVSTGAAVTAQDDGADEPVLYTGCLGLEGDLTKVAEGSEPVGPCDKSSQLAQWNQEGPQGEAGPQGDKGPKGDEGPKGEKGDPGTSATYFVSGTYEDLIVVSGVSKCDEGDLVTGGGYRQLSGPPASVVENYPSGKRGWTVSALVSDGSMMPLELEVYAVCSDLDPLRE